VHLKHELLLIFAMVIWAGSWTSGKLIATSASPDLTQFWRFVFSAVSLAPIIPLLREKFSVSKKDLLWAALGALVITLYTFMFFIGLKTGYAGAAGVLVTSMNPIFTYFLTRVFFRQTLTRRDSVGLILGVLGGAVLLELWTPSVEKLFRSGNLLFLAAALVYALVTLTTNAATRTASIIVYSFYVNLFGALFLIPFIGRDIALTPPPGDFNYWFNIVYLGVISNAFATTVYFFAVKKLGSARASSYIFIVPATALAIAAWYLGEPVKIATIVGGLIALVAVTVLRGRSPTP
jgi:drug/metabolite transporter (DMT)-like permease